MRLIANARSRLQAEVPKCADLRRLAVVLTAERVKRAPWLCPHVRTAWAQISYAVKTCSIDDYINLSLASPMRSRWRGGREIIQT